MDRLSVVALGEDADRARVVERLCPQADLALEGRIACKALAPGIDTHACVGHALEARRPLGLALDRRGRHGEDVRDLRPLV